MYRILSTTPTPAVDGHVDVTYTDRSGWSEDLGAEILAMMVGDDLCGPFVVLSYVEPSEEQMPLSFAHAHASDNWRISVRGTTNMGRDTYEQGQFRFHDGGVPYASDNFAWGPDGGYGIIMFADRRGFAIRPVKAEIAERVTPAQEAAGAFLGIDMQDPCPGAPAIATTMGLTTRAHLDGGFDTSEEWDEIAPGVRMAAGIAGEPACGPVLVFLDCAAGCEAVPTRVIGTETILAPVSGSIDADGSTLAQGRRACGAAPTSSTRPSSLAPTARSSCSSSPTGEHCVPHSTTAPWPARSAPPCRRFSRTSTAISRRRAPPDWPSQRRI